MKKHIIFLSLTLMGSHLLCDMSEERKTMMIMVSGHNALFGAGDMYKNAFNSDDLSKWMQAIQMVESYVATKTSRDIKNKLMMNLKSIKDVNDEIISNVKTVYGMKKFRTEKKDALPFKKIFTAIDHRMQLLQQRLGDIYSEVEVENKAIDFVRDLARFVGVTARKAGTDLDKSYI